MGNTIPHGDRLHECNVRCPEWGGDVQPLPGMPDAPEQPKMSTKAKETLMFVHDMDLSAEEFGEVIGALLISRITGGLAKALKEMGVEL